MLEFIGNNSNVIEVNPNDNNLMTTGQWYHVAIVRNEVSGSYYWGMYLNGQQVAYSADDSMDYFAGGLQTGRRQDSR